MTKLKLQYDDEDEYMQRQQLLEDMDNVLDDLTRLQEINSMLYDSIESQRVPLETLESLLTSAESQLDIANKELSLADEYSRSATIKKGALLILGSTLLASPLAFVVGIKAAIVLGSVVLATGSGAMILNK